MSIQNYLNQIKNSIFGKDVRQAIYDAIKQCYDDAAINHDNANMEVKLARGSHDTLNTRLNESEEKIKNNTSQLEQKTSKTETQNIQQQLNNLVLGAVGSGNNAEVVQARGNYSVLNDRFMNNETISKSLDDVVFTSILGTNILDKNAEFISGKYIGTWTGSTYNTFFDQTGALTTPIINIEGKPKLCVLKSNGEISGIGAWGIYDISGNLLTNGNSGIIEIPTGAKYFRATFNNQGQFNEIVSIQHYEDKTSGYVISHFGILKKENYVKEEKITELNNKVTELENVVTTGSPRIPVIVFNFDETSLDNRYTALQNEGFTGTWQFTTTSLQNDKTMINTLIKNGHDISPYTGLSDSEYKDTANQTVNIEKLKTIVVKEIEDMKKLGIYNPVMFSCSRHRGGYVVSEAIKDLNFKYIRCSWGVAKDGSDYYISNTSKASAKEQYPLSLNQYKTFESIKTVIDNLIAKNVSLIMPMCHTMSYDNITETNYFENLVAYIKTLADSGKVKVMNMREYYEYYYPEQGKKDDRVRMTSSINDMCNKFL